MPTIQDPRKTSLVIGSLLTVWWRRPSLRLRLPLPSGSGCSCLPLCLRRGEGPVHSSLALLWYSLSPLFCERARLCLRAFCGKVFFFFLLLLSLSLFFISGYSHSLGCCLTLAPSGCSQGIQACSPPYACSPRLPVQPSLAAGGCELLGCLSIGSRG